MIVLDVNVVVALHRADHPHHREAWEWFDAVLADGERFGVPDGVWASFVRICTDRRIFEVPSPSAEAFEFVRAVRAQPSHEALPAGPRLMEIFEELVTGFDAGGDLAPDAFLAAIALDQGATLATFDRDFARFDRVVTIRPGA